jgi:hypothetical protein
LQVFWEGRMQGGWHDFDYWRGRQRELLEEAEARRLAQRRRPSWKEQLGDYLKLLGKFTSRIRGLGRPAVSSRRGFPPDEEVAPSGGRYGLVEAVFEERAPMVRSSSVIELHREGEGYVIREVDLGTGDHILHLSTEEPEWAAWMWERKIHR